MGITLVVAITYLVINLLVDMSYALLDPRVLAMSGVEAAPLLAAIMPSVTTAALAAPLRAARRRRT